MTVDPGGLRELHWHPNADEWQYYISGKRTGNKASTMDFQGGDVGYVEKSLLHYVENTGNTALVFRVALARSAELVMAHLNIAKATLDAFASEELVIVPR